MKRKYNEIFKLKKMLEDSHIPFEWQENWGYDGVKLEMMKRDFPDLMERYQICYPCFNDGRKLSAIQGYGTYGSEQDLIEIMGLLTPEEEFDPVVGHLTAENVFERIKKDYYERVIYMKEKVTVVNEDTLEMKTVETKKSLSEEKQFNDIVNQISGALNCDIEDFYQKYNAYKKAEEEFNNLYEPFKSKLIEMYENTPSLPKSLIIGGVELTYVAPSTRNIIDSKKLKEEEPELAKKFTKTTNVKASIRLKGV